jgi:hypothetical protein
LEYIYINKFDKINLFSKLYDYYIAVDETEKEYINEINRIYNIDTPDKRKKLTMKIKRCCLFIEKIENVFGIQEIFKTNLTPNFLINLNKEDFTKFLNYIEKVDLNN